MKNIIFAILLILPFVAYSQTGNVGINTTTPTETLDVATGNVRVRNINSNIGTATDRIVVADAAGVLKTVVAAAGSIQLIKEAIGTTPQTIAQNVTADINGATLTFTTTGTTTALITYSALPLPNAAAAPVQGSIDLIVDGVKTISSYYSSADAPSGLVRLGNYSTTQKVISNFPAGSHTIKLQAKSWVNTTSFNTDPIASGYGGATASDAQAFKARISVIALN
ncbi:hypothetical protein HHL23_16115 [Chryseobacterium sp. RP-3-3]|uniref:DUF4397 domain-containing protein n=1 Tax=Chryseobacterium antibioticum TaxID=2728847 RepID=A0A7Y0APX1_9FLAO|nr:hypothetical protein [Chryseobacterium antibioticum]NML71316.1 hypothetical protein [Chryseobacterium antibioticum]